MPSYDFEVWQDDRALHCEKSVEIEAPARAWELSANSRRSSTRPAAASPSRTSAATSLSWLAAHGESHHRAGGLNAKEAPPTKRRRGSPVGRTLRPPINGAPRNEQIVSHSVV